jgi:hypothetical protein
MVFQVAGRTFELTHDRVAQAVEDVAPDPVQQYYAVVDGRPFPPEQAVSRAIGLDRGDLTTTEARQILERLGFIVARAGGRGAEPEAAGPFDGRQAAVLAPHVGKWVALDTPTHVLVAADRPEDVIAWLRRHDKRASYGMLRVPDERWQAEGAAGL